MLFAGRNFKFHNMNMVRVKIFLFLGIVGGIFFATGCNFWSSSTPKPPPAAPSVPLVFCTYFQYYRSDTYDQWQYPGKSPADILGPEPWRRNIWIGRTGDYPYLGIYNNVTNSEIIRYQIRLAQAAGISAFLLFVYDWERDVVPITRLLDVAQEEGFKIGFVEHHTALGATERGFHNSRYDDYPAITKWYADGKPEQRQDRAIATADIASAATRIAGMMNQFQSHPACLRIDGKPLVIIPYMDSNLTVSDFTSLTSHVRSQVGETLYVVGIVPQVYWYFYPAAVAKSGITLEWSSSGADAFTHWTPNGMITASQKLRLTATAFNVKDSIKWKKDPIIPIMAGFDDDAWRPGDVPAPSIPRDHGKSWSEQLDAALAAKPRFLFIQGWNEWHEGSQIEPSVLDNDPFLYLKQLTTKLGKTWRAPTLPTKISVDALRWSLLY